MIVLGVRDAFLPGGLRSDKRGVSNHGSFSLPGCELPVNFQMVGEAEWPVDYFLCFTGDLETNSKVATAN